MKKSIRPRRAALALVALALVALAPDAVSAGSRPLLKTGELQVSERVFLIGTSLKKKESPEERSRRRGEQLLRLRQRLVLGTAGARRGFGKDPRVLRALDEFRVASLVEAYLEEQVRAPARKTAAGAERAAEIERRTAQLISRAGADFPAEIDEARFAVACSGEGAGDVVIARVAGRELLADDVCVGISKVAHPGSRQTTDEGVARSVLEQKLARLRIAALAERAGYATRQEFEDLEMEQRIRLLADAYARAEIYPNVSFTAGELADYYERNKDQLRRNGEKEIYAIVVNDPDLARAIASRLAAGADFAVEAKSHTEGPGKEQGGFLGFLLSGDAPAPLSWTIRDIQPGQTSKVVETPFGYHILRCARVVDGRIPPLEEVRGPLEERLRAELQARAFEAAAARLETEIPVTVDQTLIQELMKRP